MTFKPKYKGTDKILSNLKEIASAREIIEQACLSPELEEKLRQRALIHNAHASTALAGNKLTLKEVEALFSRSIKLRKNGKP
jgi:hypothetical protein